MADEVVQSGGQPAPAASAPASPAPQQGMEQRLEAALPAGGGAPAPAGVPAPAAPQPTAEQWQGIRDYAKQAGIELPWEDDHQALGNLLQTWQKAQQPNFYTQLGQRLAPQAEKIQQWLAQQQAPQASPPPAWQAPPFKREWLNLVETDPETGQLRAKPGYDPGIVDKVQAYAEWRDKFLAEPEAMLGPMVEQRAQAIVDARLAGYQEQTTASQLVAREATWMFQGGQVGGPLTAAGQMYSREADRYYRGGLRDVRALHQAALSSVQNAVLLQQRRQAAQAPAPGAPAPTPAQQGAVPSSLGGALALPGGGAPPVPDRITRPALSMRELLMQRLNGVPDPSLVQ